MVREVLKIYTDNGLGVNNPSFLGLEITDYSFKPVRMGVSDFQAELKYGRCLDDDWTGREYVTFRGERHYIRHTPTSKKDNTDERWTHSLVFVSESAEILGNVLFYDAVYDHALTKDKPCSNSTKVTFFGDIREFCDRLNCSLKYRGIGDSILDTKTNLTTLDEPVGDGFCVQVDPYGDYDKESTWEFSFEDKYIWEVITEGFNITEIPFEKRGKRIVFGAVPNVVTHKFEYGHENELLSITHRNANAKVINRITMLGSSENIPYYYPNETEYGHISVDTTGNATLTADKVTIANMTQFLSLLSPSNRAVLHRRAATGTGIPLSKIETAFNDNPYSAYNPGTVIEHHFEANRENFIPWNVRVTFTVAQRGPFSLSVLDGRIWYQNTSGGYNDDGGSLLQGAKFEGLKKQGDISFTPQAVKSESGLDLGILDTGTYELTFSLRIPNAYEHLKGINSFCRIDTLVVSTAEAGTDASGFFWKIGDKEYKTGRLGIKVDGGLTDAMIGESIGWAASDRMPFQDHLIPPKFRQTLGAERFYEALNDTYTDPDTNKKYTFPNPFVEGAPSEHVYRDDKIKPTLKGMKNAANLYMGVIADIAFDMDDNDSLKPDTEDGDKNDSLKYEHSYFYIKLNVFNGTYGFNLFDHASQTDPMTIQMTDGSCNGCKFKIQAVEFEDETGLRSFKNPVQTTGENGTIKAGNYEDKVSGDNFQPWQQDTSAHSIWICVQKDAETFGQILPSQRNGFVPKIGDTFNIINIDLPQSYILAAEKRLEEEGIRFMSDNNEEKFTFDINASRIFFADNPDVLAELDEYSKLRVIYNGKEYEQYVSGLTINCKDGEPLPEIGISLTDTLAVGQGFVERVAERASSLIANPYTMGGYVGGAGGGISTALADKRYLNKQKADRSPHKIASDIGFEVGEFMSGSQGGIFHIDQKTGRSYIEVDEMRVRLKAIFESIQVAMLESIGGEMGITPGGSTLISYVEETETAYRCYFKGKDDDKGAECRFVVGDMVQCKESNIMDGTASAASNRYYWRLVTTVNNSMSYFELSKTDRDMTSDDKPRAGDTVMQLGNKTNNHRQSAIIMSTTNAFAPSIILYDGIDDYSLVNKAVVEYGVDTSKNPPEPFFHCYGSFFFGPRNKKTYLQFDATTGDMVFNGKFTTNCTVGDKVLADYIKEVSPPVEQEDIEDFVNNIVNPKLEGIQDQIDGVIESFFDFGAPTLNNYPANEWTTDEARKAHANDTYTDKTEYVDDVTTPTAGMSWRWQYTSPTDYGWVKIADSDAVKALLDAAKAQDTADHKRRVFTAQPTPPYDKGDLWVNATYPAGNTVKDAASGKYVNDILRCNTSRATGSFAIGDWGLASNYTDDTALNNFIAGYQTTIADIKTQVDGKAETWYQPTNPASAWTDADTKAAHKGDLWYCTADIAGTAYKKGTTWYWNGTAWEKQDIPQSVFDTIDGKSAIFVAKPTSGYKENDLWFLEADYTLSNVAYKTGTLVVAKNDMGAAWSANDWVKKDRYTDDTLAQEAKDEIAGYQYLKDAIVNGASQIIGGLFLSTHIRLGEWDKTDPANPVLTKVWAGMNGIYGSGRTIASWWGGDMVDRFDANGNKIDPAPANAATSLVRMDGSFYFAKGNIGGRPDGSGWLAGDNITWDATGAITFGNGIKIDLGGGNDTTLGGLNTKLTSVEKSMATVLALANKLSNLFTPFLGSTQKNWGDISTDSDFDNIRINAGAWTESFLSARGLNSNGGSGSGGAYYLHELLDTAISNPTSGQALVYNGTKWINQAIQTGLDEAALGAYLTTNNYAKKSDIPSLTGYATQTWVQQQGYLTAHQTIRTLTIQKNGTAVGTFNPTGSDNATLNISDVASASTLSSHTGNTTVHITAAERTKWNKVVTDFAAITGTDSDNIINKWEEVVAFLDTYTEADTLAGLLGNKADKATSITAGTGLSGGGTLAANRTLSLAASGVTAGTYFKTTVDTYGRVTSGSNPTTLSGFGITDAYTKTEADGKYVNLTGAQTISGVKTFSSKVILKSTTSASMGYADANAPRLEFHNVDSTQNLALIFTDYDSYRAPAGLKIIGNQGNEWLEAPRFIKSGGTSTQFLKADGSVDGTAYLPKATFDELFEKVNIGTASAPVYAIKAKFGLYTEQFLSARGVNPNGGSGGGSAGSSYNRLDTWTGYTSAMDGYVLSAKLGHELHNRVTTLEGKDYVTLDTAQTITGFKTFTKAIELRDTSSDQAFGSLPQILFHIPGKNYARFVYATNGQLHLLIGSATALTGNHSPLVASNFVKFGGNSAQVLMADGSTQPHYKAANVTTATSDGGMITPLAMNQWVSANFYKKSEVDTKDKRLTTYYASRPASANVNFGNNTGLYTFLATSSMTTGKPTVGDAHILHMEWDNSLSWAGQLAVPTQGSMQWRHQTNTTWQAWRTLLDTSNYSSILDSRYYTEAEANARFVTALGTSDNYLTWTKNGATNNITVPYARVASLLTGTTEHTGTALGDFDTAFTRTYQATTNLGDGISYSAILSVSAGSVHRYFQIIGGKGDVDFLRWRTTNPEASALGAVHRLLDEHNYHSIIDSRYVKKSGDTMTGGLHLKMGTGFTNNFNDGIRIHSCGSSNWASVVLCGTDNTGDTGTSANTWGIFSNQGAFGIGRNGNGIRSGTARLWCSASNVWYVNGSNTLWHAGNDGSGSGLDADLLDGVHLTSLFRMLGSNPDLNALGDGNQQNGVFYVNPGNSTTPFEYGSVLNISSQVASWQFGAASGGNGVTTNPYYRTRWWSNNNFAWGQWERLAFLSSTVANANSLGGVAASQYARITQPNNFVHAGNEITMIPAGYTSNILWFNYRSGSDGNTCSLTKYYMGNGTKGGVASVVAASFIRNGGSSSQVLNADGSVTTKHVLSSVTNLGWNGTAGQIATINTLAYWNGQYSSGASNLQYCDRGRFGTMATATATDYLARSGGSMANTNVVTNLNADLLDGYHKESFDGYKYTKIDASSLNNNTWYPVVFRVPNATQTRIRVEGCSAANASWNSHTDKRMALFLDYTVQGSDWGWISPQRIINFFQLGAGASGSNCVAGLGQLLNSSHEYVMVRGGAVYNFYTSHWITPTLCTTTFTYSKQSIAPTTTSPTAITRNNAWISDNVASATKLATARTINGTSFDGTANITTASWGTARNIYIADATAAHAGAAVSVNGAGNATLKLPATITAALVGNASTATTLQTTRTIWGQSFNGSGNVSGNISGCPRIYNAASSNMYLGNSDNSGWVLTQDICSHSAAGDTYWSLRSNGNFHCKNALVGTTTASYALNCASFICDSWVRTKGATGWYNETYGGGWFMNDTTYIKNFNSKRLQIVGLSDYYGIWLNGSGLCCEGYAGASWNQGHGAVNVGIENNTAQTPLLVAYRKGSAAAHTGNDRMFAMELLNTGEQLNISMRSQTVMQLYPNRSVFVPGGIWSDGYISARGQNSSDIRLKSCITDFYATDIIRSLSPKAFKWNAEARRRFPIFNTDDIQYGLIAQETLVKNPWLVDPDMFHDGFMGVHYDKLIPVLLKGEIEIMDDVESLKRRVSNLERENRELKRKLERIAG